MEMDTEYIRKKKRKKRKKKKYEKPDTIQYRLLGFGHIFRPFLSFLDN